MIEHIITKQKKKQYIKLHISSIRKSTNYKILSNAFSLGIYHTQ